MNDFPVENNWTPSNGIFPWFPAYGTPTVRPNFINMWSKSLDKKDFGEGVYLYNFIRKGRHYCIDTLVNISSQKPLSPNSTINMTMTNFRDRRKMEIGDLVDDKKKIH